MGRLLLVTGPPGAGKSTVAALLARRSDRSVLVDGDAFFGFLASGAVAPWLPESAAQNETVTRAAGRATASFVTAGYATVYDGVLGPWFLPTFARAAELPELDYVILLPSVETCVRRVAHRVGHGFDDEAATRTMHAEFERAAIEKRFVVRDDQATAAAVADEVEARRAVGSLCWVVPD